MAEPPARYPQGRSPARTRSHPANGPIQQAPSATDGHLRSSCLSSIMPWLHAGGAAELGRRTGHRAISTPIGSYVAFPKKSARPTARFGGERGLSRRGYALSPDESRQALHCALFAASVRRRGWPLSGQGAPCSGSVRGSAGELAAKPARPGHGDRRREQGADKLRGDQHRGWSPAGRCPGARDRLAPSACPGYVLHPWTATPRAAVAAMTLAANALSGDVDDLALAAGAGPGVQQLVQVPDRGTPGRGQRPGPRLPRAGSRPTMPSFDALTERAARDSHACRSSIRRSHSRHGVGRGRISGGDGQDHAERVVDRRSAVAGNHRLNQAYRAASLIGPVLAAAAATVSVAGLYNVANRPRPLNEVTCGDA